ncbi:unnamed protein product [Mytilus coruscus]|uniref:Uncharacterized protein n=1 Tax=Mytilus coruscus TaxID=42192 RepID=A0A6J8CGX8_MYTCO|nr:unnamed protein product [Mytilus coruscus]
MGRPVPKVSTMNYNRNAEFHAVNARNDACSSTDSGNGAANRRNNAYQIAQDIFAFAMNLHYGLNVNYVVIGQLLYRSESLTYAGYNDKIIQIKTLLQGKIKEHDENAISFWHHHGFWDKSANMPQPMNANNGKAPKIQILPEEMVQVHLPPNHDNQAPVQPNQQIIEPQPAPELPVQQITEQQQAPASHLQTEHLAHHIQALQ